MPDFYNDYNLSPPKHGVMNPFARMVWGFAALTILGGGGLLGHELFLKICRGKDHYLAKAEDDVKAKDWESAGRHLSKALQVAPEDPQVGRRIVDYLTTTGADAASLLPWIQKVQKFAPSVELQLLLAQTLFRLGRFTEARQTYETLPPKVAEQIEGLQLMAALLRAEGQQQEAAIYDRRALLMQPDSPEKRFGIALEDARHPFAAVRNKAREDFWKLSECDGAIAQAAIMRLAQEPDLTEEEARKLLTRVPLKAGPTLPARLEVLSALARMRPDLRQSLCREEVALFQKTFPAARDAGSMKPQQIGESLLSICRWLSREKNFKLMLELVPMETIEESKELFSCFAGGLAEDQRWTELRALLTNPKMPVDAIRASIWLALAASHLQPHSSEMRNRLMGAIDAATKRKDSSLLKIAAIVAEQAGEHETALVACQSLASFDEGAAVLLLQEMYAKAEQLKNTTTMLEAARTLQALRPGSAAFADRLAYLQLLCGERIETAMGTGFQRSEERGSIPDELLRAIAAYRLGNKKGMEQQLSKLSVVDRLPPGQRAVAAGLLAVSGRTDRAFHIGEQIREDSLLPEERVLLRLAR